MSFAFKAGFLADFSLLIVFTHGAACVAPAGIPEGHEICDLGATRSCVNTSGCGAHLTCVGAPGGGTRWGPCIGGASSCGHCTPGATQACDYRGSASLSHCVLGKQTCNASGTGFDACADPEFRCGTWSTVDFKECAFTRIAKYTGILADIPSGDSKQAYVLNHKATVSGVEMNAKAYSSDIWGNAWGSFSVPNPSCFVFILNYLKSCSTPFTGTILFMDPNTGMTFREGAGFPCTSECFSTNERRVYDREPLWGHEPFLIAGFGGPSRCQVTIGSPTFTW
jgi:hypothetical protein